MDDLARLLRSAGIDAESAPKLLSIAATHLRDGTAMPPDLAEYLAKAFNRIEDAPQSERIGLLASGLGLDATPGRPTKRLPAADMALVVAVYGEREAELGLRSIVAKLAGVSKNTAKARIQEARARLDEAGATWRNIFEAQGHQRLTRTRETK